MGSEAEWQRLDVARFSLYRFTLGFAEGVVCHPLWVLKTLDQIDDRPSSSALRKQGNLSYWYKLTVDIYRRNGIANGMFRGFWIGQVVGMFPNVASLIMYQKLKFDFENNEYHLPEGVAKSGPFWAGLVSETGAFPVQMPVDVVSQRMQVQDTRGMGSWGVIRHIHRGEGYSGFFRALDLTLMEYAVAAASFWLVYEYAKPPLYRLMFGFAGNRSRIDSYRELDSFKLVPFGAGCFAGMVSALVCLPLNTVRTRVQASSDGSSRSLDAVRALYVLEGPRGFFRGMVPKLMSCGPLAAISSVIYETCLEQAMVK